MTPLPFFAVSIEYLDAPVLGRLVQELGAEACIREVNGLEPALQRKEDGENETTQEEKRRRWTHCR